MAHFDHMVELPSVQLMRQVRQELAEVGFVESLERRELPQHRPELVAELGDKLGPVLWQFAPFKRFDEADFGQFLAHLPHELDGRKLDHVVEVRHASFQDPAFIRLLIDHNVAPVYVDSEDYPSIADLTGDIVYARLQKGADTIDTGYAPEALDQWAARAKVWAAGGAPDELPRVDAARTQETKPRDVFVYFIHEGKLRAPAAAMGLIDRLERASK